MTFFMAFTSRPDSPRDPAQQVRVKARALLRCIGLLMPFYTHPEEEDRLSGGLGDYIAASFFLLP